jgi:phospholipase/carboxylesterase
MLLYDMVPPRTKNTAPYYCLVLHGLGDSLDGWQPVAHELAIDELGWIFAQAPLPYYGGWSWFDIYPDRSVNDAHIRESRGELARLIDHLLKQLALPSERLFVLGFSQGCLMTMDMGLRAQRIYAGLIGISGFLSMLDEYPAAFGSALPKQHILWTHGLYDGVLPLALGRRITQHLQALGVRMDWREYAKEHSLDPVREIPDLRAFLKRRIAAGIEA